MMYVEVYKTAEGQPTPVGWIGVDRNQVVVSDPRNPTLVGIAQEPVQVAGGRFDPQRDPVGWLRALPFKYRGAYLSVSQVKQS